MNEREIILEALKSKPKKQLKVNAFNVDSLCQETDIIDKMVKRKCRQESFRNKSIEEWNTHDFIHYIDFLLKDFGISRVRNNLRYESGTISKIHDFLLIELKDRELNINKTLKDYIDWWCSIWAPKNGIEIYLNSLINVVLMRRFLSRYDGNSTIISDNKENSNIGNEEIYNLGGVDLLLMKIGINNTHQFLINKSIKNSEELIKKSLSGFSNECFSQCLKNSNLSKLSSKISSIVNLSSRKHETIQ